MGDVGLGHEASAIHAERLGSNQISEDVEWDSQWRECNRNILWWYKFLCCYYSVEIEFNA
jgi:hypothetical protein